VDTVTITALPETVARAQDHVRLILAQTAGIEHVYDGDPHALDWSDYLGQFRRDDGLLTGWLVTTGWTETRQGTRQNHVRLVFGLQGFRAIDLAGGSREAWRATLARVFDAFRASTLSDSVDVVEPVRSRLAEGRLVEDRVLGDVLAHVSDLELVAHVWVTF
jgi:hypothetical protein